MAPELGRLGGARGGDWYAVKYEKNERAVLACSN